jgi:hypothetical protein
MENDAGWRGLNLAISWEANVRQFADRASGYQMLTARPTLPVPRHDRIS